MADAKSRKKPSPQGPWYAEGLCFTCQPECGACCTGHEDYAYVYLQDDDVPRLAEYLGLSEREFKNEYTTMDDGDLVLKMDQPDCPFLDGRRCSVYDARPSQCRTFPFWEESLESKAAWKRLRTFCPGVDQGELHTLSTIRRNLADRQRD